MKPSRWPLKDDVPSIGEGGRESEVFPFPTNRPWRSPSRGRHHKAQHGFGHLPKDQHDQAESTMTAAFKMKADEGIAKLKQYASRLPQEDVPVRRLHGTKASPNGSQSTASAWPSVGRLPPSPPWKNFRRIMGHDDLWMLAAALDEPQHNHNFAEAMKAGERQLTPQPPTAPSTELGTSSISVRAAAM